MWDKIKQFFRNKKKKTVERFNISQKQDDKIESNIENNINFLRTNLAQSSDLNFRKFYIGGHKEFKAEVVYFNGMIKTDVLQSKILEPLMFDIELNDENTDIKEQINNKLINLSIPLGKIQPTKKPEKCIEGILDGNAILLIDKLPQAFILNITAWSGRSVERPSNEASTRGPQVAFNESMQTTITMIRRRLKDNNLKVETLKIGERTNTDLSLIYINDIADKEVIKRIKQRLNKIEIDGVFDIGYINQLLADNWLSPFPQLRTTERPDRTVANLLEGKAVLVLDGTPFVGIAPITFIQFFQAPEDYYDQFYIGSALRTLRLVAAFLTISLPSIYISLVSFHHELIPWELAATISKTRQGVPFPSYLEALIMEISLELLRESGIRLPGAIGQTVGIVGGLILGQAAVDAGLVSPPMVIVVSLTAISSFIIPSFEAAIPLRLLRFPMMLLASMFSVYGLMVGWLLILIHLCSLESFGQPYFAPFAPIKVTDLKDSFIRIPLRLMGKRPTSILNQQEDRQDRGEDPNEN
ncbi:MULTISPECIES: spore germination protein [unclassified Candidatus Frackibacter]|uniref:spore germination protein n=1 Tax=unclassified Candidatus Frackibacter TaxID=2648818 RepID=UPI00079A36E3|nr:MULTISPECIES: spore germination protein [unclassified Candidatus Frackibacter]KXS40372.1 MAG: spore germination protein [Candidatus Frackibacter sp. T328-2]SDC68279.1 spore germination protein [Candidatus Frackibacter sp. WG11]SEM83385.1 spore germination protein [Candidatus Frackibacter sp. WG12]SFL91887.1 spore germination protein [Candidatus Frackibacter sp. WG13]